MKPGTPYRYIEHPFDTQFGVDTSGYIGARELVTKHAHDAFNNGYSAIAPSVFREAMRRWQKTLSPSRAQIEAHSFVDVGTGKGRPVLMASEFPFRKVIGVEINPALVTIAQWNVEKWRREHRSSAPMRVVCADAASFRWPRTPLLIYLYNPFERELVERLISRLRAAFTREPHPLDILYVNPVHTISSAPCSDLFAQGSGFKHVWSTRLTMDQADQDADPYATTTDVVSQVPPHTNSRRRPALLTLAPFHFPPHSALQSSDTLGGPLAPLCGRSRKAMGSCQQRTRQEREWTKLQQMRTARQAMVCLNASRASRPISRATPSKICLRRHALAPRPGSEIARDRGVRRAPPRWAAPPPKLRTHIHSALNAGCSESDLIEIMIEMAALAGCPAALPRHPGRHREVFAERSALVLAPQTPSKSPRDQASLRSARTTARDMMFRGAHFGCSSGCPPGGALRPFGPKRKQCRHAVGLAG